MKYFIYTEFLEGPQKKRFLGVPYGETKNTIDLISIGIVSEDGREYYSISKDFNLKEAWNRYDLKINKHYPMGPKYIREYWIRQNVLKPIFDELIEKYEAEYRKSLRQGIFIGTLMKDNFSYKVLKFLIERYGKSNKQIAQQIIKFTNDDVPVKTVGLKTVKLTEESFLDLKRGYTTPEFYAYYADYDWVVFCWIFGRMIDLPKGFPMYCRDLKQEFDRKLMLKSNKMIGNIDAEGKALPFLAKDEYSLDERLKIFKSLARYPKQENEHNALADARWNHKLYNFLQSL